MKLIATTSKSILLLDTTAGDSAVLHAGLGAYYGIAAGHDRLFVAARRRLPSSGVPIEAENGEILVFDADLDLQDRIQAPFPLRDVHQIGWRDGKLWITNTYFNSVSILDADGKWSVWKPTLPPVLWRLKQAARRVYSRRVDERPHDFHHFNSICFVDDQIGLMAHNLGRGPSELHLFDAKTRQHRNTIRLGVQAHSVWLEEGEFWTCSSAESAIVDRTGRANVAVGGYPRGYASDGNQRAVGITARAPKLLRDHADATVRVFDRDWRHREDIPLPGQGMLADLCLMPAFAAA